MDNTIKIKRTGFKYPHCGAIHYRDIVGYDKLGVYTYCDIDGSTFDVDIESEL